MKACAKYSTSWDFKVSDIVAADVISAPEDGAHLSDSHRTALITGALPIEDLTVPSLRLKLDAPVVSDAAYATVEAEFFKTLWHGRQRGRSRPHSFPSHAPFFP